jgi:hypothetical protein
MFNFIKLSCLFYDQRIIYYSFFQTYFNKNIYFNLYLIIKNFYQYISDICNKSVKVEYFLLLIFLYNRCLLTLVNNIYTFTNEIMTTLK